MKTMQEPAGTNADFRIGSWAVQPKLNSLSSNGECVRVEPKVMQVLVYLAERAREVVSKEEIIRVVWSGTFVTDDVLTRAISELRKVFADEPRNSKVIQTISKSGYRLIAPVEWPGRDGARLTLAVLPFVNVGGDPELEYLSEGLTECVIGLLAPAPQLRVLPRNTVFRYKGWEGDPLAAGRELGARGVLTGRVLTYGEKVIVRAELVDAEQNCQVWGERYTRPLADLTALEDEIAGQICEALRHCLSGSRPPAATRRTTQDTGAYHLYLKARYLWNKRTPGALVRAIEYFEQAIGRDPEYALAYSGLADCYVVLGCQLDYAFLPIREAYEKAEAAARRALALDESLAEPHASLADVVKSYRWDWEGAEREFQRSIELNPRYATAHHWYAFLLSALGRLDEALREIRLAHELDPYHLMVNTDLAKMWYYAREFDRAADQLRLTLDLDPDFVPARTLLGLVYRFKGMHQEAEAELNRAFRLAGRDVLPIVSFGQLLGYAREVHRRRGVAELEELAQFRHVPACCWAALYLCQDQYDRAFEWLEKAFEERSNWLIHLNTDPIFDPLRSDPRFKSLVRRVGLPE